MPRPLALDDLYLIPFVEDAQLSPDGRRVAFVVRQADRTCDEDRSCIWMVDEGGAPRQFTGGERDHSPRWSPDGRALAFVSARTGDKPQVWLMPADGGEARQLTSLRGGAQNPLWSPDGSRILVASPVPMEGWPEEGAEPPPAAPRVVTRLLYKADGAGMIGGLRSHLFVVAVSGGEPTQLTSGDASVATPAWSPGGDRVVFAGSYDEDRDLTLTTNLFAVDAAGGDPEQLTRGHASVAAPVFLPGGDRIAFAGAATIDVGHTTLWTVSALGGTPQPLGHELDRNVMLGAPAYPGGMPQVTPDGAALVFAARDHGCTHLYRVPLAGGAPAKIAGTPDTSYAGISVGAGARLATVEADQATCGEVVVIGPEGASRWTAMVAGALDDVELPRRERRVFSAPDGTEIEGWVLGGGDEGAGRVPLLLDIHGGPHNAWSPVFDGVHLAHYVLAAEGWAVLTLNPRGSDGYGAGFYTGLKRDGWGRADLDDFLCAVDALVDEGVADADRLAVTGYSYGGFMTNVLTARTRRFRAAVSGGCVSDAIAMAGSSDLGLYLARVEHGAVPWERWDALGDFSPLRDAGAVTAPTLILHGEADERCPRGQAEAWFGALRARQVEAEMVLYPGASHLFIALGRPSHRVDYNRRLVDWVDRHCGGSAPAVG